MVPTGYYDGGLKILINPSNRIVRKYSIYEEFKNTKLSQSKDINSISRFFDRQTVFIKYKQKTAVLSGVDPDVTLNSKFPNDKFKNYRDYFER